MDKEAHQETVAEQAVAREVAVAAAYAITIQTGTVVLVDPALMALSAFCGKGEKIVENASGAGDRSSRPAVCGLWPPWEAQTVVAHKSKWWYYWEKTQTWKLYEAQFMLSLQEHYSPEQSPTTWKEVTT